MTPERISESYFKQKKEIKIRWEKTPYKGVFIYKINEGKDPKNPDVPKYTFMLVNIKPGSNIPSHRHKRPDGWTESITIRADSQYEIYDSKLNGYKEIPKGRSLHQILIRQGEIFGLRNPKTSKDLYLLSIMIPGFTGYDEIEELNAR